MRGKILIIEDEISINHILSKSFEDEYIVERALTGREGLKLFESFNPDIILLDLMLPDCTGFSICEEIGDKALIIMITARGDIEDKLQGIDLGADDYITKPFDIREVRARVNRLMRRFKGDCESGISIDKNKREVKKDGRLLKLNKKEFELINLFYDNRGIVFSREKLLDKIWGYDYEGEDRTVDVHIRRLRGKLGEGKEGSIISTVFGVGYVMK